jgi:hypothetical protein
MIKIRPSLLFSTKAEFMKYVAIHNSAYRAHSDSKSNYLSLVKQHNLSNDYDKLLTQSNYIQLAYRTLEDWNMNQRGAKLAPVTEFRNSILRHVNELSGMKSYRLEFLGSDGFVEVLSKLKPLFFDLKVMQTRGRIVGVSKTLHFLLPNLVMPIDIRNILDLLYLGAPYSSNPEKEFRYFEEIFEEYYRLSDKLSLSRADVDNSGWNTYIPKMIDNALIAFLAELLKGNVTVIPKNP